MRIARVEVELVRSPGPDPPYVWRRGLRGSGPEKVGGVLRLVTDEGAVGVAYSDRITGAFLTELADRFLREELVGADPLAREWLWERMWELDRTEELPLYVLGLVDLALWDLAGRLAGLPVLQLLGGYREAIPAYASTATYATTEEYLDVADQSLGSATRRSSSTRGATPGRRAAVHGAARARRRRRAAHVRRLGRLRPAGRPLPRARARRRRLPLVRGADARVQHRGLPAARGTSACRCSSPRPRTACT